MSERTNNKSDALLRLAAIFVIAIVGLSGFAYAGRGPRNLGAHALEQFLLQRDHALFGVQNCLFVFFEFLGDEALRADQRLFSDVVVWNQVQVGT